MMIPYRAETDQRWSNVFIRSRVPVKIVYYYNCRGFFNFAKIQKIAVRKLLGKQNFQSLLLGQMSLQFFDAFTRFFIKVYHFLYFLLKMVFVFDYQITYPSRFSYSNCMVTKKKISISGKKKIPIVLQQIKNQYLVASIQQNQPKINKKRLLNFFF